MGKFLELNYFYHFMSSLSDHVGLSRERLKHEESALNKTVSISELQGLLLSAFS